jgi:hypothetical protein
VLELRSYAAHISPQVVYALAALAQLRGDGAIGWRDEALDRLARRCVAVVGEMDAQDLVCTV